MHFIKKFLIFFIISTKSFLLFGSDFQEKEGFLLQNKKAGKLLIGMSIDELYKNYPKNLTKIVDLFKEGFFSPAIEIYLNEKDGKPSMIAEIGFFDGFKVEGISVYDKRFKRERGIGVGSNLKDLKKLYKVERFWFEENNFFVTVKELEMSFVFKMEKIPDEFFDKKYINLFPNFLEII